jgi:GH24 family phage-related lysozyme (muramidase)
VKVNEQGLALIRKFEGLRTSAYRDAAGVWTIGYGHTSMAGPPRVGRGMKITRRDAASILARDLAGFAEGVASLVRVPLSDSQFSALVSFAYNVGLENFRKSSVLRAVNAGDCCAVSRRLSLWVKAGGRVLPGLINRRAAEAALFMKGTAETVSADLGNGRSMKRASVEPLQGRAMHRSSINLAAALSAVTGVVSSLAAGVSDLAGIVDGRTLAIAAALVIVSAAIWIIRERRLKSSEEGI